MNKKLPIITEGLLKTFEQSYNSGEEYRIIIPRVLYSMYCIRNKRGMIHINNINPNRVDALYLINSSKWILSEIIRLTSNIDFEIATEEEIKQAKSNCIEYKNKTIFKKYLIELHKSRFLELDPNDECLILPNGIEYIEQILKKNLIK